MTIALRQCSGITIETHQRGHAKFAQVDAAMKTHKIIRVDGNDAHTGKLAIGPVQALGDLDRPFVTDTPHHRMADVHRNRRAIAVNLEMFPVGQIHGGRALFAQVGRGVQAVGVDDADLVVVPFVRQFMAEVFVQQ